MPFGNHGDFVRHFSDTGKNGTPAQLNTSYMERIVYYYYEKEKRKSCDNNIKNKSTLPAHSQHI